jgi:DNA-binding HxlR family transcriptional regulator
MKRQGLKLLEEKYSTTILQFLRDSEGPVITKTIMNAIEVRNWATVSNTLAKLEDARLVTHAEKRIGKFGSRAKLWRLDPEFGIEVAEALDGVEKLMERASKAVRED